LEEEGCVAVLNDFSIFLQRIVPKINKVAVVIEEDGGGRFLVIAAIAGIEHFDSNFAILIGMPWRDRVSVLVGMYPEAPVPKSMAMT
jgi:hypothetical protein